MPRPRHLPDDAPSPAPSAARIVPIFLDFEGVLRPAMTDGPFDRARFLIEPLLAARAAGLDPRLIIASTYRLKYSWRDLAHMLNSHAPGIGPFIAGATPDGTAEISCLAEELDYNNAPRLFETARWIAQRAPSCGEAWIAIDDNPNLYGAQNLPRQLILCEPELGFSPKDAQALTEKLALIERTSRPQPSTLR